MTSEKPAEQVHYPVPRPLLRGGEEATDRRFTLGLVVEVAEVLERHGFPALDGPDYADLQTALFDFVYGKPGPSHFQDDVPSPVQVLKEIERLAGHDPRKDPGE